MEDIDEHWQTYIFFLKKGLEEHAKYGQVETWRGVRGINAHTTFRAGETGVLPAFTSTSTARNVAFGFAGGGADSAVFHFTGGGFDIQTYSAYPGEAELLLEPGREYRVGSVDSVACEQGNVTVVHLLTTGPKVLDKPQDVWSTPRALKCPKRKLPICPVCSCCARVDGTLL
mmetsp:Transcript_23863/g.68876  ORF Transcript_23863/g.68876 Transcript_23863/m.68876 type:complete len:172 (-) Transcript_23863:64-579(-)